MLAEHERGDEIGPVLAAAAGNAVIVLESSHGDAAAAGAAKS